MAGNRGPASMAGNRTPPSLLSRRAATRHTFFQTHRLLKLAGPAFATQLKRPSREHTMAAFDARRAVMEGSYFRAEERLAVERHLERLVRDGKLPESVLVTSRGASGGHQGFAAGGGMFQDVPTVRVGRPDAEFIYSHQKSAFPSAWGLTPSRTIVRHGTGVVRGFWALRTGLRPVWPSDHARPRTALGRFRITIFGTPWRAGGQPARRA